MKGTFKNTKSKNSEPVVPASASSSSLVPTTTGASAGLVEKSNAGLAGTPRSKSIEPVAVVALSESGEILAAREACAAIFGRDPASLVGQNICMLLKDGFDNDVGRFLHRHRAGKNPAGTTAMRVLALRKDGTEFLAQVTTLTWNWDTAITTKADVSRLCWTAAFRDLGAPPTPPVRRTSEAARVDRGSAAAPQDLKNPASEISLSATGTPLSPASEKIAGETVEAKPEPEKASPVPALPTPAVPVLAHADKVEGEPTRTDANNGRTSAQVVALDLRRQLEELEGQLRTATGELERVKAESENRGRGEAELRTQLEAAKEAVGYAEAALREEIARKEKAEERLQNLSNSLRQEQVERSKRFEAELINLRQERDELNGKLAADQESAGEATRRAAELELRLTRNAAEFERARKELEQQTAERQRSESVWREQLDTAWIAKKELEGAWAGAVEQNKKFEGELAKLRQEHDELNARLAAEQKTADESKRRAKDVETRLNRNAADSSRTRGELDKQNAERERVEAEWREQLEAAKAAKTKLEAALADAAARSKRFEDELATLRRERDELDGRLAAEQNVVAAAKARIKEVESRLGRETDDVDQIRTKLEKQNAEKDRAGAEMREKTDAMNARRAELEASLKEAAGRTTRLEAEVAALRRGREELDAKLSAQQHEAEAAKDRVRDLENRLNASNDEVDRFRCELKKQASNGELACTALRMELESAKSGLAKAEVLLAEAAECHQRAAEELAAVSRERDELMLRLKAERQAGRESGQRAEELQRRLEQSTSAAERLTVEVKALSERHGHAESKWHEQQEAAKAVARKLETDWAETLERNVRLEEELSAVRQERDDLVIQLKGALQASVESSNRADDADNRLERNASELRRITSEIEKLRAEKDRAEAEWSEQLEVAKALARKLETAWKGTSERSRRFEGEVATLRQEREELQIKLTAAEREVAKLQEHTKDLESRGSRAVAELQQVESDLDMLKVERARVETDLRAQLDSLKAEKVELEEILSGAAERNRRLEAQRSTPRLELSTPAGHQVPPKSESGPIKTTRQSTETVVRPIQEASELERAQAGSVNVPPRHPGHVQQYSFDHPKSETRRSDTRPSRKKIQP